MKKNNFILFLIFFIITSYNCSAVNKNAGREINGETTKIITTNKNQETDCKDKFVETMGVYCFTELGLFCCKGDLDSAKRLIEQGACKSRCMSDEIYEYDVLYTSVMFDKVSLVRYFIDIKENVNKIYDENGTTLLSLACRTNQLDTAFDISKLLIEAGANVNGGGNVGGDYIIYPLFEAVKKNNVKLVELFVEKGADITVRDMQGETIFTLVNNREGIDSNMINYVNSLRQ